MREPANKRMLTDVSGLRSHRCTIIRIDISPESVESRVVAPPRLDKGHKRMRAELVHTLYGPDDAYFPSHAANGPPPYTALPPTNVRRECNSETCSTGTVR